MPRPAGCTGLPRLAEQLEADAARVRQLGSVLPPALLVEEATHGYYLDSTPTIREVRLVPQFHKRPITLQGSAGGVWLFYYPAADFPGPADAGHLRRLLRIRA